MTAIAISAIVNPIDSTLIVTDAAPSLIKSAARAVSIKNIQNMVNLLSIRK